MAGARPADQRLSDGSSSSSDIQAKPQAGRDQLDSKRGQAELDRGQTEVSCHRLDPDCRVCGKPIYWRSKLLFQGRFWHVDCFRCCRCRRPLAPQAASASPASPAEAARARPRKPAPALLGEDLALRCEKCAQRFEQKKRLGRRYVRRLLFDQGRLEPDYGNCLLEEASASGESTLDGRAAGHPTGLVGQAGSGRLAEELRLRREAMIEESRRMDEWAEARGEERELHGQRLESGETKANRRMQEARDRRSIEPTRLGDGGDELGLASRFRRMELQTPRPRQGDQPSGDPLRTADDLSASNRLRFEVKGHAASRSCSCTGCRNYLNRRTHRNV